MNKSKYLAVIVNNPDFYINKFKNKQFYLNLFLEYGSPILLTTNLLITNVKKLKEIISDYRINQINSN